MAPHFPSPGQVPLGKRNQEVGQTVQTTKLLTLLGNLSEGKHSQSANPFIGVLECVDNIRNHTLDRLDELHWKSMKSTGGPTKQMTKSLALLEHPHHGCLFLWGLVITARKKVT